MCAQQFSSSTGGERRGSFWACVKARLLGGGRLASSRPEENTERIILLRRAGLAWVGLLFFCFGFKNCKERGEERGEEKHKATHKLLFVPHLHQERICLHLHLHSCLHVLACINRATLNSCNLFTLVSTAG